MLANIPSLFPVLMETSLYAVNVAVPAAIKEAGVL